MKDFTLEELRESIPCQIGENPIRFLLPSWYDGRGEKGGYIFNDATEAFKYKERLIKGVEWKIEQAREEEVRKQKEIDDYNNLIASYGGFLSDNPMKRGKQLKTMERLVSNNGVVSTRKVLIERKLNEGWTVEVQPKMKSVGRGYLEKDGDKTESVLAKDDCYLPLNATEREYAEFLIEKGNKKA
jgi:hypothetical protein